MILSRWLCMAFGRPAQSISHIAGLSPWERARVAILKRKPAENVASHDECAVSGCGKPAERHFARGKVEAALEGEKIRATKGSVGLCRDHYRTLKKATKEDRDLERQGW